jgi:hypothetical protein
MGFPAKGNPATNAARIPIHINSWFTDPSAPRISVGEICNLKECRKNHNQNLCNINTHMVTVPIMYTRILPQICKVAQ